MVTKMSDKEIQEYLDRMRSKKLSSITGWLGYAIGWVITALILLGLLGLAIKLFLWSWNWVI